MNLWHSTRHCSSLQFVAYVFVVAYACFLSSSSLVEASSDFNVFDYIDPLIGTDNGGNVFAGATLPYGMAKAVADVTGQNTAGFSTDGSKVTGFSHMHDSGTGGNPSLGNFPLFPQTFCPDDQLDNCKFEKLDRATHYDNSSVVSKPGYFALTLNNRIQAEMTVSKHTALYKFTFPPNGGNVSPLMLLDLTDIYDTRQNATVNVDPDTGRITAHGTFLPSFGSGYFQSYACADFKGASIRDTGIYVNSRAGNEPKSIFVTRGINLYYIQAGGFTRFHPPSDGQLLARVGVSLISVEKACKNAESEIPDFDFDKIHDTAEKAWKAKFTGITVNPGGVSKDVQTSFWSGIYRTMISPQDYTGENPLWSSNEPYFDSFYCIWDSFRSQHPFLTIIDPLQQSRMVRSLIDTWRHLKWLPDCRMSLDKGFTQGGSNADVVLTDAYLKNLTGINWKDAYKAVVNDAENEPLEWSNEGRGGLMSWKRLNYIPFFDYDYLGFGPPYHSISRTLEYAYNDFCISSMAYGMNHMDDYKKYRVRAESWRNLFKKGQKSFLNGKNTGFTGFFQPKYSNGTWGYQDPVKCSPLDTFCSLTSNPAETFESSIWEYQFFVPQDQASLIGYLGGSERFIKRLDFLHESGLLDIGNEPSFLTVFQYHYAGRPGLSAKRAHYYIPSHFNASTTGLPGNDDSGASGSFLAMTMSGLFPNPGQNVYFIIPPFFESVSYKNQLTGKTATVKNVNFDKAWKNIYIQKATLDGKPYRKNWIGHEFFTKGQTLELTLGPKESSWGTQMDEVPPSLSSGH